MNKQFTSLSFCPSKRPFFQTLLLAEQSKAVVENPEYSSKEVLIAFASMAMESTIRALWV